MLTPVRVVDEMTIGIPPKRVHVWKWAVMFFGSGDAVDYELECMLNMCFRVKLIRLASTAGDIEWSTTCHSTRAALFLKEINAFFIGPKEDLDSPTGALIGAPAIARNRPPLATRPPYPFATTIIGVYMGLNL